MEKTRATERQPAHATRLQAGKCKNRKDEKRQPIKNTLQFQQGGDARQGLQYGIIVCDICRPYYLKPRLCRPKPAIPPFKGAYRDTGLSCRAWKADAIKERQHHALHLTGQGEKYRESIAPEYNRRMPGLAGAVKEKQDGRPPCGNEGMEHGTPRQGCEPFCHAAIKPDRKRNCFHIC